MKSKSIFILFLVLCLSSLQAESKIFEKEKKEFKSLTFSLSSSMKEIETTPTYKHFIKSVSEDGRLVTLEDEMSFAVNWWDRGTTKKWQKGDQIYIMWDGSAAQFKLVHVISQQLVWASKETMPKNVPTIRSLINNPIDADVYSKLTLTNDHVFRSNVDRIFLQYGWKVKDRVVIFAMPGGLFYQLWNLEKGSTVGCKLIQIRKSNTQERVDFEDILGLEERLNKDVLQQPEATKTVAKSLLIYSAGLTEKERPMGVFLFLGPTGVGKTELAKVLTKELYKDPSKLLRFDMSHFHDQYTASRLIGSPPGYVNHEEGGQLTEPLLNNPYMVVLLDEMEKAHPKVHKMFLPIFDDGYIFDTKNTRVDCSHVIFIMTSNLCGPEIARLYRLGYSDEDILSKIEPELIKELSPELYNRVEPVIFRPLEKETMEALVDLSLSRLIKRIFQEKEIRLTIDDTLKYFLVDKGYHPLLGARPLKKLIEKKVVATLAYAIIKDKINNGTAITLMYDQESDSVLVITE